MGNFGASSGLSGAACAAEPPLSFGPFRLMPRTGELWRGGTEVRLTPRAAAVFALLLERSPQVVTKQELIDRIWERSSVGDEALTSCIKELRRALADDAREPRYIETRHRRGYRLIVPVATAAPALPDKPAIAVMPFQNMSGDAEQEYFVDGLVEDIITALSRISAFFVIARNPHLPTRAALSTSPGREGTGRALRARRIGPQVCRPAASLGQLIDATTGNHIWADRYEGRWKTSSTCRIRSRRASWCHRAARFGRLKLSVHRPSRPTI